MYYPEGPPGVMSDVGSPLKLEIWEDVARCLQARGVKGREMVTAVMRGDQLMSSLSNIDTLYGFTQVDLSDSIEICSKSCEECGENKGVINILAKGVAGSPNTLTGVTAFPPALLQQG